MIQRLQTIYFLLAAILIGALLFVPFAEIVSVNGEIYRFDTNGCYMEGVKDTKLLFMGFPILLLSLISIVLILFTLLQYKRRQRQKFYSRLIILILLVLSVIIGFDLWRFINLVPGNYTLKIYIVFPLIAVIFIYLAIKAITKDEKLLKSVNRIR